MEKHESIFIEFLGDTPLIRLLDFFIIYRDYEYSKESLDLGEKSEVIWAKMVDQKIITKRRTAKGIDMFSLNKDNLLVKIFIRLNKKLMLDSINEVDNDRKARMDRSDRVHTQTGQGK